uniref:Uncharacterized protein n=1 Tax=Fagus sylvatica TaxID=28930 RepID=A0A2N9FD29_FAGSY
MNMLEQLVSLPEAEMFLHKVISNAATDETSINEQSHMQEFAQVVGDEKTAVCETSQRVFGTEPPDESASNDLVKTNPTQVDSGINNSCFGYFKHLFIECPPPRITWCFAGVHQSDSTSPLFFPLSLWIFLVALLKK